MTRFSPRTVIYQQAPDSIGDHSRPPRHVPPGEAQDAVAGDGQTAVPVAVGLERLAGAVACAPIDLDDQVDVPPKEVHYVVEQRDVHFRLGKVAAAAERQETLLQLASGYRGTCTVGCEHSVQGACPGAARMQVDDLLEL